ncbi:MAG: hypothetical protein ACREJD_05810 [Phycisphaerales bacterium]
MIRRFFHRIGATWYPLLAGLAFLAWSASFKIADAHAESQAVGGDFDRRLMTVEIHQTLQDRDMTDMRRDLILYTVGGSCIGAGGVGLAGRVFPIRRRQGGG